MKSAEGKLAPKVVRRAPSRGAKKKKIPTNQTSISSSIVRKSKRCKLGSLCLLPATVYEKKPSPNLANHMYLYKVSSYVVCDTKNIPVVFNLVYCNKRIKEDEGARTDFVSFFDNDTAGHREELKINSPDEFKEAEDEYHNRRSRINERNDKERRKKEAKARELAKEGNFNFSDIAKHVKKFGISGRNDDGQLCVELEFDLVSCVDGKTVLRHKLTNQTTSCSATKKGGGYDTGALWKKMGTLSKQVASATDTDKLEAIARAT